LTQKHSRKKSKVFEHEHKHKHHKRRSQRTSKHSLTQSHSRATDEDGEDELEPGITSRFDDVNQLKYIRKLYAAYVNKMRDEWNMEPLEVNGRLNRLALRVIGKEKFCGKTLSSRYFSSYEINCLTLEKSELQGENEMIDKVLAD